MLDKLGTFDGVSSADLIEPSQHAEVYFYLHCLMFASKAGYNLEALDAQTDLFDLLLCSSPAFTTATRTFLHINLIPLFLSFSETSLMKTQKLWAEIKRWVHSENKHLRSDCYGLLLQFLKYMVPLDPIPTSNNPQKKQTKTTHAYVNQIDIRLDTEFWAIIQAGLLDENPMTCKRSAHILLLVSKHSCTGSTIKPLDPCFRFLHWNVQDKKSSCERWSLWFHLFETLDEFASHVFREDWAKLELLLPWTGNEHLALDLSWISILFQKALSHQNKSIRKHAILWLFSCAKFNRYPSYFTPTFFFETIIPGLDDINLYRLSDFTPDYPNGMGGVLSDGYKRYFDVSISQQQKRTYMKEFLRAITKIRFAIVMHFHLDWIRMIEAESLFDQECLQIILELLETRVPSLEIFSTNPNKVKESIRDLLVDVFFKLWDVSSLSHPSELVMFIDKFGRLLYSGAPSGHLGQLSPNTLTRVDSIFAYVKDAHSEEYCLTAITNYFKAAIQESMEKMTVASVTLPASHLSVFLLAWSRVADVDDFIKDVSLELASLSGRAHLKTQEALVYTSFFGPLLIEALSNTKLRSSLTKYLLPLLGEVHCFVRASYDEWVQPETFSLSVQNATGDLEWHFNLVQELLSFVRHLCMLFPEQCSDWYSSFCQTVCAQILSPREQKADVYTEFSMMLQTLALSSLLSVSVASIPLHATQNLSSLLDKLPDQRMATLDSTDLHTQSTGVDKEQWARYVERFFGLKWHCIQLLFSSCSQFRSKEENTRFFEHALSFLDRTNDKALLGLLRTIQQAVPIVITADVPLAQIENSLRMVWAAASDQIKYWQSPYEVYIEVAFHEKLLSRDDYYSSESPLHEAIGRIMGVAEKHQGIANMLAYKLIEFVRVQPSKAIPLASHIASFCIFGPNREPDQADLIPSRTSSFDTSQVVQMPVNINQDCILRAYVNLYLQSLNDKDQDERVVIDAITTALFDITEQDSWQEAYKLNSFQHRQRVRLWQSLCILAPIISHTIARPVAVHTWKVLTAIHQPSTRPFIEHFAFLFLIRFPEFVEEYLWPYFEKQHLASQVTSSLFVIACNIVLQFAPTAAHPYIDKAMYYLVPMHNNMQGGLKVVTQNLLRRMVEWASGCDKADSSSHPLIDFLSSLAPSYRDKESEKSREKFRIHNQWHLDKNKMIQTLFEFLPLGGEMLGEIIPLAAFDIAHQPAQVPDQLNFQIPVPASLMTTTSAVKGLDTLESSHGTFQEKIQPWVEEGQEATVFNRQTILHRRRQDLIVVASLIDKAPNLGGLARTCEIFQANKLVIGNAKMLSDPTFCNVSVTAEKWLPVEEVPEQQLAEYLLQMRLKGYQILGVEQASNSINLEDYSFPTRAVLLLGKEKEGIPVEYLQLVDQCIEIPQLGVIRSLNVHVTGAIIVWEYTRQHLLRSKQNPSA
eukprot:TRINITY_DN9174_c0_g1_i4.p1 TRINITY_DN9174_c0_g1~~TRINITY_DN9174_c0_g1_i4.p1  ORF type:complete len:1581 (-),score=308.85 TRINITY_DN9174_c0_g1_i4:104-4393(-)